MAQLENLTLATKQQIQKFESMNAASKATSPGEASGRHKIRGKNLSIDINEQRRVGDMAEEGSQEVKEINHKLMDAYRMLDRHRKKLKKVKSLVYHDTTTDEENDVYKGGMGDADNPSDANWFKLRDVKNEITFKKQEIEKLRKDLAVLGTTTEKAKNLHEE